MVYIYSSRVTSNTPLSNAMGFVNKGTNSKNRRVQSENYVIPLGARGGGRELFDIFPVMAPVDISPEICRLSYTQLFVCALGGMVYEFTVDLH